MKNRKNNGDQFEADYENEMREKFSEYDEYDDSSNNIHGKQKSMKNQKNENKPKWRTDRKREKKFKHDVLGID